MLSARFARRRRWRGGVLLGALAAALVTALAPGLAAGGTAASADTQAYVAWSSELPGWTDQFVPSSANDCVAGRPNCLNATLKELSRIADSTAKSCSHDAVFSRAYVRMTQTYGWARDIPGYYQDVPFANHLDAVFAKYYTDAYYNYQSGSLGSVPQAWQIAFNASKGERVSGSGSLMLGMNAHINRDLPFVLAATGLVAPDGSSRKPDYDADEKWLSTATKPLLAELAARFDPTADDASDQFGITNFALFQLVSGWREAAWRNAEALVSAPTPAARAQVAASIENNATTEARTLMASDAYMPPLTSAGPRDQFCAAHHGDAPPLPYDFGTAKPYGY
jgi:hypothetical protein